MLSDKPTTKSDNALRAEGNIDSLRKLRIVITVNSSWNLVNFRRSLIEGLISDGHSLTILAPRDDYSSALEGLGCRFIALEMDNKGLAIGRDAALVMRFFASLRKEHPDVVFSFTIKNNIYGAFAAGLLGVPFVPNITGLGTAFIREGLLNWVVCRLYRVAFRRVPSIFFQNEDDLALFVRSGLIGHQRTQVLPGSGINLRHFVAKPQRKAVQVRFLLIARMLRDKGVVEFVEAARLVHRMHPDAEFCLLGPAGADNRTAIDAATIKSWVNDGVVSYLGATDDVRPTIAESDCVVLPSYREGTPRTILEASATARAVIATDVPGCRSAVEDGVTGLLCKVRDPRDLAEKMTTIIEMGPTARAQMGRAGRNRMETLYDEQKVVNAYREQMRMLGLTGPPMAATTS